MTLILQICAWAALVATLVLSPSLPELTNTVAVVIMILSVPVFIYDLRTGRWRPTWKDLLPVIALAIFGLTLIPTTRSAENYVVLLAVLPLALSVPLTSLFSRLGAAFSITTLAVMAFAGSVVASSVSAYAVYVLDVRRAWLTMNPIHLGDLALTLGFLSLAGIFSSTSRWRWWLLLGPVLGFITIYLSGSRGPLLTFAVIAVVAVVFAAFVYVPRQRRLAAFAVVVAGVILFGAGVALSGVASNFRGLEIVSSVLAGNYDEIDNSTARRLQMYEGAWHAFLSSPVYGHGGEEFTNAAGSFVEMSKVVSRAPHLHSDLADFAAIGGVLGLLSYVLLIAAPLVWAARGTRQAVALWFVALVLSTGYVLMGLTNAMFGILTLTALYSVVASGTLTWSRPHHLRHS